MACLASKGYVQLVLQELSLTVQTLRVEKKPLLYLLFSQSSSGSNEGSDGL